MGCASSSPFISSTGNGALKTANDAATKVLHSGEETLTEIKDSIGEKAAHVKEAIVGAAQNVGHEIENAFNNTKNEIKDTETKMDEKMEKLTESVNKEEPSTDFKIIPLKDPNEKLVEETLDELASTMDDTTAEMKDVSDNVIENTKENVTKTLDNVKDNLENLITNSDNTDMQSIDSLKTSSPEPEIEKILSNDIDNGPPTPVPNISELEKLHMMSKTNLIAMENDILDAKENLKKDLASTVDSIESKINTAITNT